jgi:hypothetical protein
MADADLDDTRFRLATDVLATVEERTGVAPNTDFAIGALLYAAHMQADAGEAIFAIARCAGWIAHALEEYGEAPLRFRLRAAPAPARSDAPNGLLRHTSRTRSTEIDPSVKPAGTVEG